MKGVRLAVSAAVFVVLASCDGNLLVDLQAKIDMDRENVFVSFLFPQGLNPQLPVIAEGIIEENTVTVLVPVGTDVTSLIAEFEIQGKEVVLGDVIQESRVTSNDFSASVIYTVRSLDGSAREYEVTVREASDNADLSHLSVVRGSSGAYTPYLEPSFDTSITNYLF